MSLLTESRIRAAKLKPKPYKLRDGRGLYLLVQPSGARLWRLRFRQPGRESMVSLGAYPDVSLKLAANVGKKLARRSPPDPAAQRRAERAGHENTFQPIALEWLEKRRFVPKTLKKAQWTLNDLLFPHIGSRPIALITALTYSGSYALSRSAANTRRP